MPRVKRLFYLVLFVFIVINLIPSSLQFVNAQTSSLFTVSIEPSSMSAVQGDYDYATVSITAASSVSFRAVDQITLKLDWIGSPPSKVDYYLDTSAIHLIAGETVDRYLSISPEYSSSTGKYALLLTATAYGFKGEVLDEQELTIPVEIMVFPEPRLTLSPEKSPITLTQGESESVTLEVSADNDNIFTFYDVEFSTRWIGDRPSGIKTTVEDKEWILDAGESDSTNLEIDTSTESSSGIYELEITAVGTYYGFREDLRTVTARKTIEIQINTVYDFSIEAEPSSISAFLGSSNAINLRISTLEQNLGPLNTVISLNWKGSPPNETNIRLVEKEFFLPPGESVPVQVTVDVSPSTLAGKYVLTIEVTGTSDSGDIIVREIDIPILIKELPPDFKISSSPESIRVFKLDSTVTSESAIKLEALASNSQPVDIQLSYEWVSRQPQGIDVTIDQLRVEDLAPGKTVDTKIKLTFFKISEAGQFELKIIAKTITENPDFDTIHEIIMPIENSYAPVSDFAISINPSTLKIVAGESGSAIITVSNLSGDPEPVTLSITDASDLKVSFSNNNQKTDFSSDMVIETPSNIKIGNYDLTIVGEDRFGTIHEVVLNLEVIAPDMPPAIPPPGPLILVIDSEPRLDSITIDNKSVDVEDLAKFVMGNKGEQHLIAAQEEIIDSKTKYKFERWSDGIESPVRNIEISENGIRIVAEYRTQHYLEIVSPYGEAIGTGWYDEGSTANFGIDNRVSGGFGVDHVFNGWSGDSVNLIGQSCPNIPNTDDSTEFQNKIMEKICMNAAHVIVADWKTDTSVQNMIIIGSVTAAAVAGTVGVLAKTNALSKLLKSKRPKIPILSWDIHSPDFISTNGNAYIDITLRNVGETDAQNVKVEVNSADLDCPAPHLIETLMPWESRKISFVAKPRELRPSHNVTVTLQSKYIPRKEVIAVIAGSEIKYVPKKEKSLSFLSKNLKVCVIGGETNSRSKAWLDRLRDKGFLLEQVTDLYSIEQLKQYDVILFSALPELNEKDVSVLRQLVLLGKGIMMFGFVNDKSVVTSKFLPHLLDIFGCGASTLMEFKRCLRLRIIDADHPVTRGFNSGDVFEATGGQGVILAINSVSGKALVEQWIQAGNNNDLVTLPAVIANIHAAAGSLSTENRIEERTIYLNIDAHSNVMPELIERSILWLSHGINHDTKEQD